MGVPDSTSSVSRWESTALWKTILASATPDSHAVKLTLQRCMPDIERLLMQGGSAPTDFTLHDAGHGFRVAERMSTITPADVLNALSPYELAFLLMSAYLHDIGMTPEVRKVRNLHDYLLTGEPSGLDANELKQFQRWLDDHADGMVPPLAPSGVTGDVLRHSSYLITHYCRSRHNDWSEDWIRHRLVAEHLGTYSAWLDDLVALCRSHHYGYEELRSETFDPRLATSDGIVVRLRFLAAILRVADILEFDPERTPDVIFRHRDISPSSIIYWWKDHDIALKQEGARLVIAARPTTAAAHHAIELTVDDIDRELELCRRLAVETHFEKCPGLVHDLPHRWGLEGGVHRDIRPREGKYEYIDGAFRPKTSKLLELLSGLEMYGDPIVAVRELLQNAFDAVREQSAYQRLEQPVPSDPVLADNVARLHRIELRLEEEGGDAWLVCKDTGVGMTKAIIKDHLLVSGSGIQHQVRALGRRCKDAGFQLGRTGQFGIGVLSYFMLGDRVVIRTRRSQQAGDSEGTGWWFETDGVGSFGELRENIIAKGTEVRLHLRGHIVGAVGTDRAAWFESLIAYLKRVLERVPCELQVNSPLPGCEAAIFPAGWVDREGDMSRKVVEGLRQKREMVGSSVGQTPRELLPLSRRIEEEEAARQLDEAAEEVGRCLRWKVREGVLPDGLGTFRLHLPYFELANGASLAFLRVRQKEGGRIELDDVGVGKAYWPDGYGITSWQGIGVQAGPMRHGGFAYAAGVVTEVSFEGSAAGRLLVNRDWLVTSAAAEASMDWLRKEGVAMRREFAEEHRMGDYTSINYRTCNAGLPPDSPFWWVQIGKNGSEWKEVEFPVVNSMTFAFWSLPREVMRLRGRPVSVLPCLGGPTEDDHYDGVTWSGHSTAPEMVVVAPGYGFSVAPVWLRSVGLTKRSPIGLTAKVSPRWKTLVGVECAHYAKLLESAHIWSQAHPLVGAVDAEGISWCRARLGRSLDPLQKRSEVLGERARAAAWVALCLRDRLNGLWDGLVERDREFLEELWRKVFEGRARVKGEWAEVCQWVEDPARRRLRVLTPRGWHVCREQTEIERRLPDPGREWKLILEGKAKRDEVRGAMRDRGGETTRRRRPR